MNRMHRKSIAHAVIVQAIGLAFLLAQPAQAALAWGHNLFKNNMILQRDVAVPIFGTSSASEAITVTFDGQTKTTTANASGAWRVSLDAHAAGNGPYTLKVKGATDSLMLTGIAMGDIWLCSGQSNMELVMRCMIASPTNYDNCYGLWDTYAGAIDSANFPNLRYINLYRPDSNFSSGNWETASPTTVGKWSALGFLFGRDVHRASGVPIGLYACARGNTELDKWLPPTGQWYVAKTQLYFGLPIKGTLWDQGENNGGDENYGRTLPTLINGWRTGFGQDSLPALIVQLQSYLPVQVVPVETIRHWNYVREGQFTALSMHNTGLAILFDIDEPAVHPQHKYNLAHRLALWALNRFMGGTDVYSGPIWDMGPLAISGKYAKLRFVSVGSGMTGSAVASLGNGLGMGGSTGAPLTGFAISDNPTDTNSWHWANTTINADTITCWNDSVPNPTAVRYGWADHPCGNLYNLEGLPASPFRTDGSYSSYRLDPTLRALLAYGGPRVSLNLDKTSSSFGSALGQRTGTYRDTATATNFAGTMDSIVVSGLNSAYTWQSVSVNASSRNNQKIVFSVNRALLPAAAGSYHDTITLTAANAIPTSASYIISTVIADTTLPGDEEVYTQWSYLRNCTLNTAASGANVTQTQTNFPVLVRLTSANFTFSQLSSSAGADIRFATSQGRHLPYHIERITADSAELWVKVDSVYGNNTTQYFTMYWGKSGAVDRSDTRPVFDTTNGFMGVWHLAETPGSTGSVLDKTLYHNNGTPAGSMSSTNVAKGIIGKGINFNGSSNYINFGNTASLNLGATTKRMTVSTWINITPGSVNSAYHDFLTKGDYSYCLQLTNTNRLQAVTYQSTTWNSAGASSAPTADTWYHVVGTYDGTNTRLYLDGALTATSTASTAGISASTANMVIGQNSESANRFFNGIMDEVRVQNRSCNAGWIKLCYENQKAAQTLVRLSAVRSNTPTAAIFAHAQKPVLALGTTPRMITVRIASSATHTVEIFSLMGERIYRQSGSGSVNYQINSSVIGKGMFIVQIKSAGTTLRQIIQLVQ